MTSIAVRCQAKEKFAELRETIESLQSELCDAREQGAATQAEQVQAAEMEAAELRTRTALPASPLACLLAVPAGHTGWRPSL